MPRRFRRRLAHTGRRRLALAAVTTGTDSGDALARRTLTLVNIPSVSRDEAAIARAASGMIPGSFTVHFDDGEAIVASTDRVPGRPLVLFAGHLDTVPAQDNLPGRIEGDMVVGLGATDMKGGLAVMLELAAWIDREDPVRSVDVGIVMFTREELPVAESPLPAAFSACPLLGEAALVVVMEPTDNTLQGGCVGNLNATLRFHGTSAHSARPWDGDNAIARAVQGLGHLVSVPPRPVEIEGLTFTEVISVTCVNGGIADNVIPDLVECRVNFRFTPDRSMDEAREHLHAVVGDAGELEITSVSPSGAVCTHLPLARALGRAGGFDVAPKQAWTPVAQFTEQGIPAVNLGPGATRFAHRRDEQISISEMRRTLDALKRFVTGAVD